MSVQRKVILLSRASMGTTKFIMPAVALGGADDRSKKPFTVFYDVLRGYGMENVRVIVEPGNALVASCFSFVSEVIDVKRVEDKLWFVTTDGSRNDIDPFFRKTRYLSEIVSSRGNAPVLEQVISGCTCLEYDRLFSLRDYPLLSVGDRIIYHNVGAYTMTLSPMFIRYWPAVYLKDGDDYRLVRRKWTADEYLAQSL